MKKILILIIIFLSIFQINNSYAIKENINPKIVNAYNLFINKLEKKYTLKKQITLLKQIDEILEKALKKIKSPNNKIELIKNLKYLNLKKFKRIQLKIFLLNKAKSELEKKENLLKNENIFKSEYKQKSNYNYINKYSILKKFKKISSDKNNIFLENGIWYYYKYSEFKFFNSLDKIKQSDFEYNGIFFNKSLVFLNITTNNIGFANNFQKIKLIDDKIIYGVSNKYNFLLEIKDDKEFLFNDTDNDFKKLKQITLKITNGLSNKEKIKIIYNYLLENNEYSQIINLNNKKIFSGIELYKNKQGVCEAYVKLFIYMLNFAGINDSEIIRGYVIDAKDFPQIGHAWLRIGDKYYDPTFDDPLGLSKTREYNEYRYFGLPKDLFYTNRYNYKDLPDFLKTKTLNYRKTLIQKNLYNIYKKYQNNNFILLNKIKFKINNNIPYNKNITISNLNKIIPLYEVKNFKFIKNGKTIFIKKINYFNINNENNIDPLLEQLKYNLDGYYFFKWYKDNGTYEYRLGYNLEF